MKTKEPFFCCKDQDNVCHPIGDYCSTGRARREHSPIPWKTEGHLIYDADDNLVGCGYGACDVNDPDYERQATENAALIVRCVNEEDR